MINQIIIMQQVRIMLINLIETLKSSCRDFNDGYILVTGNIATRAGAVTKVAFKNPFLFIKCITQINGSDVIMQKI